MSPGFDAILFPVMCWQLSGYHAASLGLKVDFRSAKVENSCYICNSTLQVWVGQPRGKQGRHFNLSRNGSSLLQSPFDSLKSLRKLVSFSGAPK